MPTSKIRVFLLDDHEVVRRGLRTLLEGAGDVEVVGESGSAIEGAKRIAALKPDVAVLDMRLPDGSGIDVCREVRSVDPTVRALILTSYDDDRALLAAILAGASGYLVKELKNIDLVASVRHVAAGRSLIDPVLTARVLERARNPLSGGPRPTVLTGPELEFFGYILNGRTNREISEQMVLTPKVVEDNVASIVSKLDREHHAQDA